MAEIIPANGQGRQYDDDGGRYDNTILKTERTGNCSTEMRKQDTIAMCNYTWP